MEGEKFERCAQDSDAREPSLSKAWLSISLNAPRTVQLP